MALMQLQVAAEKQRRERLRVRSPHPKKDEFGIGRLLALTSVAGEEF